jgi:hypothetical protein
MNDPSHQSASVSAQTVELLLSSMFKTRGPDGRMVQFLFGLSPGAPSSARRVGTTLFFRQRELLRAVLHVRQNGPVFMKSLAFEDIARLLKGFATENYCYMAGETFLARFDGSYADHVSPGTKGILAEALADSEIFNPKNQLVLYPLVPVRIEEDFDSSPFFLIRPASLNSERIGMPPYGGFAPEEFPPDATLTGRKEKPSSWLGVRSPLLQTSNKVKAAILGALALTPYRGYRHQFSMRSMFGGICRIGSDGSISMSFGDAHTPPMSEDIVVTRADHAWLQILAEKLGSAERPVRRQMNALQYFYRAWPLDPSERFPWLCMTLDALYGDATRATQTVIDCIKQQGEIGLDETRLRLLLTLRGDVIHGRAPDVHDSKTYYSYYEKHGSDPIADLDAVTVSCLRHTIFGTALAEHPDPYAHLVESIRTAQSRGA